MKKKLVAYLGAVAIVAAHMGLTIVLMTLFANESQAKVIYHSSQRETIPIVYGDMPLFQFEKPVAHITSTKLFEIKPASEKSPDYSLLSVRARFLKGTSKVTFILSDGTTIHTKLVILNRETPEKTDSFYNFKNKADLIPKDALRGVGQTSAIELMKSMILGQEVAHFKIRELIRTVKSPEKGVEAKLIRIYTGQEFTGYIFRLRNKNDDKEFQLNEQNLNLGRPNRALVSHIRPRVLGKKGTESDTAYVYIAAKPNALYYTLKLPMAYTNEDGKITDEATSKED